MNNELLFVSFVVYSIRDSIGNSICDSINSIGDRHVSIASFFTGMLVEL